MKPPSVEDRVLNAFRLGAFTRYQISRMCGTDVSNVNKAIAKLLAEGRIKHDGFERSKDTWAQRFARV